jgi:hypothetical protein
MEKKIPPFPVDELRAHREKLTFVSLDDLREDQMRELLIVVAFRAGARHAMLGNMDADDLDFEEVQEIIRSSMRWTDEES